MSGCRPTKTPIDLNLKFVKEGKLIDRGQIRDWQGKFIYLSHTRPDISFDLRLVSQFMHAPGEEQQEDVYRILRYLQSSPEKDCYLKRMSKEVLRLIRMQIGLVHLLIEGLRLDIVPLFGEIQWHGEV